MRERDLILQTLGRYNIEPAGEFVQNPDLTNGVYVPVKVSRVAGKTRPSQRALAALKRDLAEARLEAEFILVDPKAKSVEGDLRASLLASHPNLVRNAFVSIEAGRTEIWIDEKSTLSSNEKGALDKLVSECLKRQGLKQDSLQFVGETALATNSEILALIRNSAPIDIEGIAALLRQRDFPVPSIDWLNRKLDALRKSGALISLADRSYVLSAESIHKLGTRKDRHSPDVARLLALARRGE